MVESGDGRPVKSAERTLDILEWLAGAGARATLGELARALGIPKSSLHALLRTMQRRGWIETDASGTRFGLGVRSLRVGTSYVDSDDEVEAAAETLDWLAATLGETVHFGRLDGADIVYLAKRESAHPLRLYSAIGRRLPAHTTALGKALLAERSMDEVRRRLGDAPARLTDNTLVDWHDLVRELAQVRAQGFAIDREENTIGISCYAVTVGRAHPRTDAISCSVPIARLTADLRTAIVAALQTALQRLSSEPRELHPPADDAITRGVDRSSHA
jgi:DNA-binding IclR family transcriptional regulator